VATIDRRGLKQHFLKKHRRNVDQFYRQLGRAKWRSEPALKCNERFQKNRDKLFTFFNQTASLGTTTTQSTPSKPSQNYVARLSASLHQEALRNT
jgi:hypothetical protein